MRKFQLEFRPTHNLSITYEFRRPNNKPGYRALTDNDPEAIARGHMDPILKAYEEKSLPPEAMEIVTEALVKGDPILFQRLESIRRGGASVVQNHARPSAVQYKDLETNALIEAAKTDIRDSYKFLRKHDTEDFLSEIMLRDGKLDIEAYLSLLSEDPASAPDILQRDMPRCDLVTVGDTVVDLPQPNIQQNIKLKALHSRSYELAETLRREERDGDTTAFSSDDLIELTRQNRELYHLSVILEETFRQVQAIKEFLKMSAP